MVPEDRKTPSSTTAATTTSSSSSGGFFYGLATRVVSSVATAIDAVDQSLTSPPPPTSANGAVHRRRGDTSSLLVPRKSRLSRMAAGEVSGDESADEYVLVPSPSCESLASQASIESTATFASLKESSSGSDADDELVLVSPNTPKDVFSDDDTMFFDDSDHDTAASSNKSSLSTHTPLTRQNVQKLQKSTAVVENDPEVSSTRSSTPTLSSVHTPTSNASAAGTGLQVCESTDNQKTDFPREEESAVIESLSTDASVEETRTSQEHERVESDASPRPEGLTAELFSGVSSFFSTSFHGLQKVASTVTDVAEHALDTAVDASTGLYADGVALTGEIVNETVAVGKTIVVSSLDTIEDVLDTIVAPTNTRPPSVKTREQLLQQLNATKKEAGESEAAAAGTGGGSDTNATMTPTQVAAAGTGVELADEQTVQTATAIASAAVTA